MTEQIQTPTKEDQLVAALAHAALIIHTVGLLVPIIIWITQKDRSAYLKKQALQAAIWQATALVIQILLGGCYLVSYFLMIPLFIYGDNFFYIDPSSGGALAGGLVVVFFLISLIFLVGGFAYLGFGIAGAVQCLKGKDFRYPFIGRWVDNSLSNDVDKQDVIGENINQ